MKRTNSIKYSKLSLYKKDNINRFRKDNFGKIKREKSIRENIKEFKLKNNRIYRVYDYYEYLIDDKDFPQHLNDLIDSDIHSFSDIHIGNIGPYGYFWDRISIMFLLRIKLEKERFLQEAFVIQYLKTVRKEYQNETIENIIEKSKNSNVSLYKTHGDENYPVNVAIEINEAVHWNFNDPEYKLEWIFKKEDYFNTLNTWLDFFDKKR